MRELRPDGTVWLVAGSPGKSESREFYTECPYANDGAAAKGEPLCDIKGLVLDKRTGRHLIIVDGNRLRQIDLVNGIITTIAGG